MKRAILYFLVLAACAITSYQTARSACDSATRTVTHQILSGCGGTYGDILYKEEFGSVTFNPNGTTERG